MWVFKAQVVILVKFGFRHRGWCNKMTSKGTFIRSLRTFIVSN